MSNHLVKLVQRQKYISLFYSLNSLPIKNFTMSSRFDAYEAYKMASQLCKGSDHRDLDDFLLRVGVNSKVRSI